MLYRRGRSLNFSFFGFKGDFAAEDERAGSLDAGGAAAWGAATVGPVGLLPSGWDVVAVDAGAGASDGAGVAVRCCASRERICLPSFSEVTLQQIKIMRVGVMNQR